MEQDTFSKKLQAIIDLTCIKGVCVEDYDSTLPDGMDERDAGGLWDLAGVLSDILGRESDTENGGARAPQPGADLQTLLYELMYQFKNEMATNFVYRLLRNCHEQKTPHGKR